MSDSNLFAIRCAATVAVALIAIAFILKLRECGVRPLRWLSGLEDGTIIDHADCTYIESHEKEECECDGCSEGTVCKDGCVSFSQKFGRALKVPGIAGTIRVFATHPSTRLFTTHALAYDHPMMRRVVYRRNRDAVITDGCGGAVEYRNGYAVNCSTGLDAQIYIDDATNLVEVLPSRLRMVYGEDGAPIAFIPENGGYLPISEFGVTVTRDASGAISSITSDTDGAIVVSATGANAWRATWTSPSGAFVKRFDFSGNGSDVLNLTEYRNEDYSFNYRWTYDSGEADWVFEKGVGTDAAVRESKTTEWDDDSASWIVTRRSENAAGGTLSSETSVVAEEAGTLKTTSVVKEGKSLYSAELDGGFVSAEVSSLGSRTEYSRDRFGRMTRSVEYSNCGVATAEYREYDYSKGVYRDHRPVCEKTKLSGVEFLSVSREIGTNYEYVVRTAAGSTRESYTEYDAYGRIVLRIAESGVATSIAYADDSDGTIVETENVGYISDDQFTLSDGKSTREVRTIDSSGNVIRRERYAYIGGAFHLLAWETHQYNAAHKVVASTYSDGTSDAADWICPGPTWRRDRDGIVVSNHYNAAKLLASSVRYGPFGAVTTTYTYDGEGRVIREETSAADCETKVVSRTYDNRGRIASETDELGATTSYAYSADDLVTTVTYADGGTKITTLYTDGSVRSVTGTAVTPEYYTYGVTSEGLKWTHICYGRADSPRFKTTYVNGFDEIVREERSGANDSVLATVYYYDNFGEYVAVYADGIGPDYEYDEYGRLAKRTWARGIETFYAYDGWGNLTNTSYSDSTPTVAVLYDALGRQIEAHDAAGVTTFAYDVFGANTNETVIDIARSNVIERFYDMYGRDAGYSLNGVRRTTIGYDAETGRISTMLAAGLSEPFRWSYLGGSDLKSSLEYPNEIQVSWEYESHRDLLTLVSNDVYSVFRYTYDEAGRRVSKNDELYQYNERGELLSATNVVTGVEFAYGYDDIGNRLWSRELGTNCTYVANELNQYTNIVRGGVFELSAFDLDGNQTNIVTSTGEWSVECNGENRPVRWHRASDDTTIIMSYDRKGRRVKKNDEAFVYDGYLNITETIWDPTERVATRPLLIHGNTKTIYFCHDGNKNVVNEVHDAGSSIFSYSTFGVLDEDAGSIAFWRFSSEFFDRDLDLIYYNYRHYIPTLGRWLQRDVMRNQEDKLYLASNNRVSKNDEFYQYNELDELVLATNVVTGAEFANCYDVIGLCHYLLYLKP